MGLQEILEEKREDIYRIAARHGVVRVSVFGSVARGNDGPDSDVDFLIEVRGPTPPWFPGGLVAELEEVLGRHVDVVEAEALAEDFKQRIVAEAVPL